MSARILTTKRERAYAKLTLSLRVLGTRDDGFHELEALTVAGADLYDDVNIAPQSKRITCAVSPASAAPGGPANLAARAGAAIAPFLPPTARTFRINLKKRLPMGAGLGGGSADAAAVLRALGGHFALRDRDLHQMAAGLGSDVPFCLTNAPAWMRGRGERIDRIASPDLPTAPLHLVVVTPSFECATPPVFRAWDAMGSPRSGREVEPPDSWQHLAAALANDLEPAAEHVEPRLGSFRVGLAAVTGRDPILLGSGSSYALWCESRADADEAAAAIAAEIGDARLVGVTTVLMP